MNKQYWVDVVPDTEDQIYNVLFSFGTYGEAINFIQICLENGYSVSIGNYPKDEI